MLPGVLVVVAALAPAPCASQAVAVEPPVRYDRDLLPPSFHAERRESVKAELPDDAVALVLGSPLRTRQNDVLYEYRQDSDLLYLTGAPEPGSALLLAPGGVEVDGERVTELLFVPPRSPAMEVWTGRRFGPAGAEEALGVEMALSTDRFGEVVAPLLSGDRPVFVEDRPEGVPAGSELAAQLDVLDAGTASPDRRHLRRVLDALRTVKTEEELRLLGRAVEITVEAHREVMRALEPGMHEYEAEALIEYVFKREGAEHPGFPSIVGSGENAVILHYETSRRRMEAGDLVVMDVGAEYHGYTADVTRTVPVSGTFSPEQRAVYELVLAAQEAAIDAVRAGGTMAAPSRAAARVLAAGLAELGLIDSPGDAAGLRRFYMHGVGHYLGLDVHDVGTGRLPAGAVITVEPGIYIAPADDVDPRWWNIGVRIEDDVLVTGEGPVVLSGGAPKSVEAIEAIMAGEGAGG